MSHGLAVLIALQGVELLWSWVTLGYRVALPGLTFGGLDLDLDLMILSVLLVARSLVWPGDRARLLGVVARARRTVTTASPRRRLALAATGVLVVVTLDQYVMLPVRGMQTRTTMALSSVPELQHSTANGHVEPLIDFIAGRVGPESVAVYLESRDCRGHEASFYAYPRLLLMAPSMREWTLAYRQLRCGMLDVGHPYPGPRPGLAATRAFARERGVEVVVADEQLARALPPHRDGASVGFWD